MVVGRPPIVSGLSQLTVACAPCLAKPRASQIAPRCDSHPGTRLTGRERLRFRRGGAAAAWTRASTQRCPRRWHTKLAVATRMLTGGCLWWRHPSPSGRCWMWRRSGFLCTLTLTTGHRQLCHPRIDHGEALHSTRRTRLCAAVHACRLSGPLTDSLRQPMQGAAVSSVHGSETCVS